LLSKVCSKVKEELIDEFFSDASLSLAFQILEPHILEMIQKKYEKKEERLNQIMTVMNLLR
jgi:hypothetical protein